jgi:hypothetical protein
MSNLTSGMPTPCSVWPASQLGNQQLRLCKHVPRSPIFVRVGVKVADALSI